MGAVVLVSLAVIFVPVILDGTADPGMPAYGSNVPPKPDYSSRTLEIPLQVPAPPPVERRVIDSEEQAKRYEEIVRKELAKSEPTTESEKKTSPIKTDTTKTAPRETAASTGEAAVTASVAWAVQVGSFSQSANALALRDKLREKGFAAFVEQMKSDGGLVYRVRVGPELKRENAETIKQQLADKFELQGLLVSHP